MCISFFFVLYFVVSLGYDTRQLEPSAVEDDKIIIYPAIIWDCT